MKPLLRYVFIILILFVDLTNSISFAQTFEKKIENTVIADSITDSINREDHNVFNKDLSEENDKNIFTGWDTTFHISPSDTIFSELLSNSIINHGDSNELIMLFNKIRTLDTIKVGYIGGSITVGASATTRKKCYAMQLCNFLNKSFSGVVFIPINKGISATGSRFGCSRINDDILSQHPDLTIIEYSVNDNISDSIEVKGSMEGLIRKCINSGSAVMMLCMIYKPCFLIGSYDLQNIHSAIGKYYNIPIISYRNSIETFLRPHITTRENGYCNEPNWPFRQVLDSTGCSLWYKLFGQDDIHPNNTGHFLAATLLYEFLRNSFLTLGKISHSPPLNSSLIDPSYENADIMKIKDIVNIIINHGWKIISKEYNRIEMTSYKLGDSVILQTNYKELSIMYGGKSSVKVIIDGQNAGILCYNGNGYLQIHRFFINNNNITHNIKLKNLSNKNFKISYFLYIP